MGIGRPSRTVQVTRLLWRWNRRIGLLGFLVARLRVALAAVLGLFVLSTIGYMVIEKWDLADSTFMSMITLSTVGYAEVHPLSTGGRVFTMIVIVAAFLILVYAAAELTNLFTSGEAAAYLLHVKGRRMREELHDHIIVVGFGRVGQATCAGITELGRKALVIERNAEREQAIVDAGFVPMIGDATSEADLVEAGIHRARALIAAAEDDAINLIVTLTARAVRTDLRIVSRVNEGAWQDRIERAGADIAHSPYKSYGLALAAQALNPGVLEMHTMPSLGLAAEEIQISSTSSLIGSGLQDLSWHGQDVFVLGVRREREFRSWNNVVGPIQAGDILLVLGPTARLNELASLC